MKRIVLTVLLLITNIIVINAQEEFSIDKVNYTLLSDTEVMVSGSKMNDYGPTINTFKIPAEVTYGGKKYKVVKLGSSAFFNSDVANFVIPETVRVIGEGAFRFCPSLVSVTIPASVDSIDFNAFEDSKKFTTFKVEANNNRYKVISGILYNKAGTELISCPTGKMGVVSIPASVKIIKKGAFYDCQKITGVTFANGLEIIEEQGFARCFALTRIVLPKSLKFIRTRAFDGCTSLQSVTMDYEVNGERRIFRNCHKLETLNFRLKNGSIKKVSAQNLK